jgi:hypothetical protein
MIKEAVEKLGSKATYSQIKDCISGLITNRYKFAAQREFNDLWIEIALDSPEQEVAFVNTVQNLLSFHCEPFKNAKMKKHCRTP